MFRYPNNLLGANLDDPIWDKQETTDNIKKLNKSLLDGLTNNANVYAIFTKTASENWTVCYVGERKAKNIRQRINEHLINKHDETNAKLDLVRSAVKDGKSIGLRFIFVKPDTYRTYIEEEIISRNKNNLPWNIQS